jgi:hypothetical protein
MPVMAAAEADGAHRISAAPAWHRLASIGRGLPKPCHPAG